MSGIVGFTPVIIKKKKLIRIITIEQLFHLQNYNDVLIWTNHEWSPIKAVSREKTDKKIYRISNPYNWIYITEDCRLLLDNGNTIQITEIKEDTNLFQVTFPVSNKLDLEDPDGFFDIKKCEVLPIKDGERIETKNGGTLTPIAQFSLSEEDNFIDFLIYIINRYNLTDFKQELSCFSCKYLKDARISDDLCMEVCEEEGGVEISHFIFDCYINCKNKKAVKNILYLFRNNLEPYRILTWSFLEMQKVMILSKKVSFNPKFPISSAPMLIRFNLTYETLREDFIYLYPNGMSYEYYLKFAEENFPERLLIYPLFLRNCKGYDTREPQTNTDLIVGPPKIIGSDGTTHIQYIFDYDQDYVYRVIANGFYNAGVGSFIIKEFEVQI